MTNKELMEFAKMGATERLVALERERTHILTHFPSLRGVGRLAAAVEEASQTRRRGRRRGRMKR